tara:strand:- start:2936 stop:3106 length:171 start_codon:yes stop_codon:yes gene_type:complete
MTLEGRFKVGPADKKYGTEAYKRLMEGNPAYIWAPPQKKAKNKDKFKNDPKTSANA